MTHPIQTLPVTVKRPLVWATVGVSIFLVTFVVWAITAPLATTISLRGSIVSSQPSVAIQHPYGGSVQEAFFNQHDKVEKGDILLQLDVSLERKTLETQIALRDRIILENEAILTILTLPNARQTAITETGQSPYFMRERQVALQTSASLKTVESLTQQIEALEQKISHSERQLALISDRAERLSSLSDQGLLRRSEDEQIQEQVLMVRGEIDADRASVFELESQIIQTQRQSEIARVAFEHELAATKHRNLARLDELQSSILDLTDRIDRSVIRAPISGIISSAPLAEEHLFASRGATLMTLSQPLKNAQVAFDIPVDYIDQIQPGMSAKLIIPSLPQRQMPKIDLAIEAISPRAEQDEAGNPTTYRGLAVASSDLMETISHIQNIGEISEDMPVVLIVSVRETTFANYLTAPLIGAFSQALQD